MYISEKEHKHSELLSHHKIFKILFARKQLSVMQKYPLF